MARRAFILLAAFTAIAQPSFGQDANLRSSFVTGDEHEDTPVMDGDSSLALYNVSKGMLTGLEIANEATLLQKNATGRTLEGMEVPEPTPEESSFMSPHQVACEDDVALKITKFYQLNKVLIDQCVNDSNYQIFPYTGEMPNAEYTSNIESSLACMAVITGGTLLDIPQCTLSQMDVKAVLESFMEVSIEMDYGRETPGSSDFLKLINWRRDVNLASEANLPNGSDSEFYAIYEENLATARMKFENVQLNDDLTISFKSANKQSKEEGEKEEEAEESTASDSSVAMESSMSENGSDEAFMPRTQIWLLLSVFFMAISFA